MAAYKVEICGVNTAKLPILKESEKEDVYKRQKILFFFSTLSLPLRFYSVNVSYHTFFCHEMQMCIRDRMRCFRI